MKRNRVLSMLFAGMFLAASAGIVLADMEESPAWEPYQGEEASGPSGSFQYEGAVETGSLPPGEDLSNARSGEMEDFTIHESGGIEFRQEVDAE